MKSGGAVTLEQKTHPKKPRVGTLKFGGLVHYLRSKSTGKSDLDTVRIDGDGVMCWSCNSIMRRVRVRVAQVAVGILVLLAPGLVSAQTSGTSSGSSVVHFKGTMENVKATFGPAEPVAHVKPGGELDANSLDCFGNALQKPGDPFSNIKIDNPLTGPFFIDGAEPGDTLVVKILDLQVDSKQGVGTFGPGFGAANSTHYTPMLEKEGMPERAWYYPIDTEKKLITFQAADSDFKVQFPMHPFLGCIGVAPANGEARSSIVPAEFGGNMDAPEISPGNTLYLPVNVKGALFYFGDGHAAMGDGEVAGSAVEVPMKARFRFDVVKGKSTGWPRLENENELMAAGIYRPVDDAVRIAVTELIHWMNRDYGLSELDGYELFSKVGKLHLTEMVDPNYVVIASIDKKYLPAKK
jgi:amidase